MVCFDTAKQSNLSCRSFNSVMRITDTSLLNLVRSNPILIILFRLIWHQTVIHLVPNKSKKDNYNLNFTQIYQIQKIFICYTKIVYCFPLFVTSKNARQPQGNFVVFISCSCKSTIYSNCIYEATKREKFYLNV